ncbi:L-dopachrome tautomerase-related protein [Salinicola rhizosphaerae]|uniref:Yellow n=1 Tax=Salinicola rhizosphaerae TaxID=1443141 RepID=A0ABQ3DWA2_9GAMM|nr:L-dopachrome tautomerase-related protein [Salinicola rhizosphaerae]GHB18265.1 yellow [Salinicola rhizosphaerae]
MINRRQFCQLTMLGAGGALMANSGLLRAAQNIPFGDAGYLPISKVAELPWLCNAVATTADGRLFAGLPRWPGFEDTPSVVEILDDGTLKPFPGGEWNAWKPGKATGSAFVCVNTIHIFDDDSLWLVDQGTPSFGDLVDDQAQKVLQFNTRTGELIRQLPLPDEVMPKGASLNDLRLDSENVYLTDSGLGGIVIVNLESGQAMRRLHQHPSTQASPKRPPIAEDGKPLMSKSGKVPMVHSDPIEISPDGRWLYYQPLTGPLYRIETAKLRDPSISDEALGEAVEFVFDTSPLTGTAMDSAGNFYMAEMDRPRISVLTPDGDMRVLAEDNELWGPDAMFITRDRKLLIPIPQTARLGAHRGPDGESVFELPFDIYQLSLPGWLGDREVVPSAVPVTR